MENRGTGGDRDREPILEFVNPKMTEISRRENDISKGVYCPPFLPLSQRETGVHQKCLVETLPTAQLLGAKIQSSAKLDGLFPKLQ